MSARSATRHLDYICRSCLQKRALSTSRRLGNVAAASAAAVPQAQPCKLPAQAPAENRAFKLSESRRLIMLQGVDAASFLNGITTNIVPDARSVEGLYSAFLTAQPCAPPVAAGTSASSVSSDEQLEPAYLVDISTELAPQLLRHLRRYKLRAKVTVRPLDGFDVWSVPNSFRFADTDTAAGGGGGGGGTKIGCVDPRAPGMGRRVVLPCDYSHIVGEVSTEEEGGEGVLSTQADDEVSYRLKRYLLGVPEAPGEIISGTALPQESNMDYMAGINFRKGCYVGQELTVLVYCGYRAACGVYDPAVGAGLPAEGMAVGGNIARVNKKGRTAGKFLGGVGNVGLALCRLEIMTGVSLGEGVGYDPAVDEFRVEGVEGGGEEVRIKAFVPEWHTTGTITSEAV
ncbi:hypothetical protein DRE_01798 [Drechslerella stenobrocha 248]|uniref:Iron-sulfur cluster assembly factor IBA57 homolog, mitochondrial n=1 Tax=Drechslerella stenobrocha 248 TaxID=1043628 RepID=W7HWN3_9PEZI|nr:hypothetical protein DRE_01798 [Drechslerella stenobrocha 248]